MLQQHTLTLQSSNLFGGERFGWNHMWQYKQQRPSYWMMGNILTRFCQFYVQWIDGGCIVAEDLPLVAEIYGVGSAQAFSPGQDQRQVFPNLPVEKTPQHCNIGEGWVGNTSCGENNFYFFSKTKNLHLNTNRGCSDFLMSFLRKSLFSCCVINNRLLNKNTKVTTLALFLPALSQTKLKNNKQTNKQICFSFFLLSVFHLFPHHTHTLAQCHHRFFPPFLLWACTVHFINLLFQHLYLFFLLAVAVTLTGAVIHAFAVIIT